MSSRDADALIRVVEQLTRRVDRLESLQHIRNLQSQYGYYLDKCLFEEAADLFADDGTAIFLGGIYRGKDSVRRLYVDRLGGRYPDHPNGPVHGFLLDHPIMQEVLTLDEDGERCHGRFRTLMQAGTHESAGEPKTRFRQWWEGGIYENVYVRDTGIWKFQQLYFQPVWQASHEDGWAHTPPGFVPNATRTYPDDKVGPDEILPGAHELWPHTDVVPFHYPHPVTGEPWTAMINRPAERRTT